MVQVNFRKWLYFMLLQLRGHPVGTYYKRYLNELQTGIPVNTTRNQLIRLLSHSKQSVPYYAKIIHSMGDGYLQDPEEYLRHFPVLTKDIIRSQFDELKSSDLHQRHWFYNTSGDRLGNRSSSFKITNISRNQEQSKFSSQNWSARRLVNVKFIFGVQREILFAEVKVGKQSFSTSLPILFS